MGHLVGWLIRLAGNCVQRCSNEVTRNLSDLDRVRPLNMCGPSFSFLHPRGRTSGRTGQTGQISESDHASSGRRVQPGALADPQHFRCRRRCTRSISIGAPETMFLALGDISKTRSCLPGLSDTGFSSTGFPLLDGRQAWTYTTI